MIKQIKLTPNRAKLIRKYKRARSSLLAAELRTIKLRQNIMKMIGHRRYLKLGRLYLLEKQCVEVPPHSVNAYKYNNLLITFQPPSKPTQREMQEFLKDR